MSKLDSVEKDILDYAHQLYYQAANKNEFDKFIKQAMDVFIKDEATYYWDTMNIFDIDINEAKNKHCNYLITQLQRLIYA